ncbi:MAG TPA: hypothetical protein VIV61_09100, partial [Candidatus Ozemobacteraceae bacterium]
AGCARSLIVGAERQIRTGTRAGIAWFHQDFGAVDPAALPEVADDAPFREGWRYLAGRRYLLATFDQEMDPLVRLDLAMLANACDGSTLWQPKLVFNTGDDSDLTLFAWVGAGADAGAVSRGPVPGSEFGSVADGIGFLSRWFF